MIEVYDGTILAIFQTATIAAVAGCSQPGLPTKYVSIDFTPPNDQKWLECVFLPNNRRGDFWGNEKNYQGTWRLVLHWPNDGQGAYAPMALLAEIAGYFDKDDALQDVTIYDNPDSGGVLENGSENLYPISLRYQCFRS